MNFARRWINSTYEALGFEIKIADGSGITFFFIYLFKNQTEILHVSIPTDLA